MIHETNAGILKDGRIIKSISIENENIRVVLLTLGANLNTLFVRDKNGNFRDISLGFNNPQEYLDLQSVFGMTIGPVANRISNASFNLNGNHYSLKANNFENCLHSADAGFQWKVWDYETEENGENQSCRFSLTKQDMDGGFPGKVDMSVTYTLTGKSLILTYSASSDKDTYINPTNHSYFNLSGCASEKVCNYYLQLNADSYLEVDEKLIPTGKILPLSKDLDFSEKRKIGMYDYDHCYMFPGYPEFRKFGEVFCEESGIGMSILSDLPAMQLYTANTLAEDIIVKDGNHCTGHGAVCFETQFPTDGPNREWEHNCLLKAGKTYTSKTEFIFTGEGLKK